MRHSQQSGLARLLSGVFHAPLKVMEDLRKYSRAKLAYLAQKFDRLDDFPAPFVHRIRSCIRTVTGGPGISVVICRLAANAFGTQ